VSIEQSTIAQPERANQSPTAVSEFWRVIREHAYQYILLVITIYSTLTAAEIFNWAVFFSLCASAFLILFGGYIRALRAEEIKLILEKLKVEQTGKLAAQREADQLKSRVEILLEQKSDLEKIRDYLVQQITAATDLLNPQNLDLLKHALAKLGGAKP
jgi:hypothetical protein